MAFPPSLADVAQIKATIHRVIVMSDEQWNALTEGERELMCRAVDDCGTLVKTFQGLHGRYRCPSPDVDATAVRRAIL